MVCGVISLEPRDSPSARWSLATLPLFSSSTDMKYFSVCFHQVSGGALRVPEPSVPAMEPPPPAWLPDGCCWPEIFRREAVFLS
jgi:hypothetical protein